MIILKHVLTLHLFSACALFACQVTPASQTVPKEELVARTKTIVLAKAVAAEALEGGRVKYTFKAERRIKGAAADEFTIEGAAYEPKYDGNHFKDHQEEHFWSTPRGRCVHDTDCRIHPSFEVGRSYLIFLEMPYHQKSFEQAEKVSGEATDKWLAWVMERCKAE